MATSPSKITSGPALASGDDGRRLGATQNLRSRLIGQSVSEAVFSNIGDIAVPVVVLGIVMAMITPLPPFHAGCSHHDEYHAIDGGPARYRSTSRGL